MLNLLFGIAVNSFYRSKIKSLIIADRLGFNNLPLLLVPSEKHLLHEPDWKYIKFQISRKSLIKIKI